MKTRTNQPITDYEGIVEGLEEQASSSGVKIFEDIKDKDGHNRFIEGEVNLQEGVVPTKLYGKWALSGSHLLIVLCLSAKNGDVHTSSAISYIDIPDWILDKIVPIYSVEVVRSTTTWYAEDGTSQSGAIFLEKTVSNELRIWLGATTFTADRQTRIAFDLLIDNE